MSRDRIKIVEAFVDGWNRRDVEAIVALFAADAVYHNIPMEEVRGIDAIRAAIQAFVGQSSEIEWIVHDIAQSARGAVLTERTDIFTMGPKRIAIRVMGIFEFSDDDLITGWRDYFDLAQYTSQLAG